MRLRLRLRLRGVLLVLALLLAATAVVPVLLLGDADDGAAARVAPAPPFNSSRVKAVSWQPRIFVYRGFLSDAECDHLVELGKKKVQRSMVADNDSGKSVMSEVRTSSGTFLRKGQVRPFLLSYCLFTFPLWYCLCNAKVRILFYIISMPKYCSIILHPL